MSKISRVDAIEIAIKAGFDLQSYKSEDEWRDFGEAAVQFAELVMQKMLKTESSFKVGNLVTYTQDDYPALGDLYVQLWEGKEVAARVYGNSSEEVFRRIEELNTKLTTVSVIESTT